MNAKKWIPAFVIAASLVGLSSAALAADFEPFTPVENVCPDCEKPKADVISLSGGDKIRGTVVAENSSFYTVVRYGEVRAIPRSDVQGIVWADGSKPSGLMKNDQIVLQSGHVLSGTIVDETDKPAFFQIKSSFSDYTYTVAKAEVQAAYKGGSEYAFSTGEEE
jgi:hypothetical protein